MDVPDTPKPRPVCLSVARSKPDDEEGYEPDETEARMMCPLACL